MRKIKHLFYLVCFGLLLISCNSNALKQENAEKTIQEFLAKHGTKTSGLEVSPATIRKIGKTNVYTERHTNVRVHFNSIDKQQFTLLFDFSRTSDNRWFLKSVEGVDGSIEELNRWLKAFASINIAVQ